MTVSSATNKVQSVGNGSTTAFSFPYPVKSSSHLVVTLTDTSTNVETVQTITTHYTVTLASDLSSATVTFLTAPAVGIRVTIKRRVPYTQTTDYTESSTFPAEATETALDLSAMASGQLSESVSRSLQMKETSTFSGTPYVDDPVAGNIIGWNDAGTALENKGAVPSSVSITSFLAAGGSSPSVAPTAAGANDLSIGSGAATSGPGAIAIGQANASGDSAIAIGISNSTTTYGAQQDRSIALGYLAKTTGTGVDAVVLGGRENTVDSDGNSDFVVGGQSSTVEGAGIGNGAIGGRDSHVQGDGVGSVILGGDANHITSDGLGMVIVGGNDNDITNDGAGSVILGGSSHEITGDGAGIVGGFNHATGGDYSALVGGQAGVILGGGDNSVIVGGTSNQISGDAAAIVGGNANLVSATQGAIVGGNGNTVSATAAVAMGTNAVSNHYNQVAHASGKFANNGDAQKSELIWRISTSNATPAEMFLDGSATRFTIASDTTYMFDVLVVARRTDADNESAGYRLVGVIDNNAGTTALVGTVDKTAIAEDTAAWDAAITADNTNDALTITVTGEAAKTIRWVAHGRVIQVNG